MAVIFRIGIFYFRDEIWLVWILEEGIRSLFTKDTAGASGARWSIFLTIPVSPAFSCRTHLTG